MPRTVDSDPKNRPIPQKDDRTFDADLKETLEENIRQLNEHEETLEKLKADTANEPSTFSSDEDLASRVDDLVDERLGEVETDAYTTFPISVTDEGVVVGRENAQPRNSIADVRGDLRAGKGRFDNIAVGGPSTENRATIYGTLQLEGPGGSSRLHSYDDTLHVDSTAVDADTNVIRPAQSYQTQLGTPQKKFLTLHAAELWVEQLVAQQTRATIGGKVFVGPTSTLAEPLARLASKAGDTPRSDAYNYIRTKHNGFSHGEVLMMEARGRVEFMRVVSRSISGSVQTSDKLSSLPESKAYDGASHEVRDTESVWVLDHDRSSANNGEVAWNPTGTGVEGVWSDTGDPVTRTVDSGFDEENPFEFSGGVYRYKVERDLDGTGANRWFEGDTVISTGTKGTGFIELFAQESMREAADGDNRMLAGPTIAFSIRDDDKESWGGEPGQYYNEWSSRTAVGRLSGHYDYNPNDYVWGIAAGDPSETWIAADDTEGFRILNDRTQVGQWATDGSIYVGPYLDGPGAYPFTVDPDGNVTMYGDLRMPDGSGGYQRPSVWQGEWAAGTDYVAGDTVGYKGNTFICREDHTSQGPTGDTPAYGPPQPDTYDTWDFQTQSSSFLYLTTDGGPAIKNSSGSVTVQAKRVTGGASTETYTGSDYELSDGTDTYPLGTTFDASDIEGELSLQLQPTGGGEALDSIKLVDITDGLGGGYVQTPGGLTMTRYVQSGSFDPADLTLTGVFYPAGQTSSPDEADVTIQPVGVESTIEAYYSSDLDPNGDNDGTISVSVQNASGDSLGTSFSGSVPAEEVVVSFTYTDPNSGQQTTASETVYLTTETVPAPFTSYVFQRASSKPSAPTGGGNYSNPSSPSGWSDAPPSGDSTLWMSKAQYTYEDGGVDPAGWSDPVKADARAGTFTIWAPESPSQPDVSNVSLPSGRPPNGSWTAESGWKDDPANVNGDAYYMAQSIWDDETGWSAWKKTRVKGEKGADAVNLYILAPSGTAIKNSTGSLEVEAHIVEAGSDSVIDAGGTYSLVLDDSGSRQTLGSGTGSQVTSGKLHYELSASEIDGGADVYLTDGSNDYDAITLVDVSDGESGDDAVYGSINPSNGLAYVQQKNANGWDDTSDTTLTATFYKAGSSVATGDVTVSLDTGARTVSSTDSTGSSITAETSGENTGALTVEFTHDASGAKVSETVTVTRAGDKGDEGPQGPEGPEGPPGDDNQDFAFLESGASDFADGYSGLAMTNEYLGYITTLSNAGGNQSDRWRTYFDNTGNLYLNDDNDDDAFVFESDGSPNNKGRLTIGDPSGEHVRFEEGNIEYTGGLLADSFTVDGTLTINNGALVAGKTKVGSAGIELEAAGGYVNNAAIEWTYQDVETLMSMWTRRVSIADGGGVSTFRDALIETQDATPLHLQPEGKLRLNAHKIEMRNNVSELSLYVHNIPTTAPNDNDKVWRDAGYLRIGPG